jgi:hypothetical protein
MEEITPYVGDFNSGILIRTSPMEETQQEISTPYVSCNHFSAIAPAATRPIVSRAEDLPPPEDARVPYLTRVSDPDSKAHSAAKLSPSVHIGFRSGWRAEGRDHK